jgi:hypothetical protein
MDTPGWLGRDLEVFPHLLKALRLDHPKPQNPKELPCEILYPEDFMPKDNPNQVEIMEHFIADISKAMGCTYRKISLQNEWKESAQVEEKDLRQYLYNVSFKELCQHI